MLTSEIRNDVCQGLSGDDNVLWHKLWKLPRSHQHGFAPQTFMTRQFFGELPDFWLLELLLGDLLSLWPVNMLIM